MTGPDYPFLTLSGEIKILCEQRNRKPLHRPSAKSLRPINFPRLGTFLTAIAFGDGWLILVFPPEASPREADAIAAAMKRSGMAMVGKVLARTVGAVIARTYSFQWLMAPTKGETS